MKKILFAVITIVAINACNSPQKMTSPNGDSMNKSSIDTTSNMQSDTMMKRDSM